MLRTGQEPPMRIMSSQMCEQSIRKHYDRSAFHSILPEFTILS
jgi:hypothetical protein